MLLKDNEEKRNIAWRTVMAVTSVLIVLIVVFFAVKLFTSNPLTGNWENTDDGMKLTIKNNGTMNIVQTLDESTVSVPVDPRLILQDLPVPHTLQPPVGS